MIVRPRGTLFHAGSGDLRVFNDDRLAPGESRLTHSAPDIEVVTYVAEGLFKHAVSPGYSGVLSPGSVQRATLAPGTEHFEGNQSATEPMRFIQMWIVPARRGLEPSVEQRDFNKAARRGRLLPVLVPAPGYGTPGAPENPDAVTVHQDAAVYTALIASGRAVTHRFRDGFDGYLFLVHGDAHAGTDRDAAEISAGGAAKIIAERELTIWARQAGAEVLLVETRAAVTS
jgi:redox-sensitive bicupin YhaK (pirin superfamily)